MMLQKLPIFLKENSAKILIKYDGERDIKKYTVRLLYSDIKCRSLGSDTDLPCAILKEIFVENEFVEVEEILDFYNSTISYGIEILKNQFGNGSVISIVIAEKDGAILYTIHIQNTNGTRCLTGVDYIELYKNLLLEKI